MPSKTRPCKECGAEVALKITRDIERKWFCSRQCRSRFYGKRKDMTAMWDAANTPESNAKKGRQLENHPRWRPVGSTRETDHGYIKIKLDDGTWDYEHRVVAEATGDDFVHHANGNSKDNSSENLVKMTNSDHARLHALERHRNATVEK